jgi:hypothetical protein
LNTKIHHENHLNTKIHHENHLNTKIHNSVKAKISTLEKAIKFLQNACHQEI